MAYISSTFSTTNAYVKYRLVVELYSQDIVGNTSTVNVQLQAWRTNSGYTTYGSGTASVNVEGSQFNQSIGPSQTITYNSYTVLYTGNHIISHNADGTKSPSIGGYFYINAPVEGGWNYFTFSLPTIPRTSQVYGTNADIESSTSININRYSSNFTHTLRYAFGSLSGTIATGVGTSYGWMVPSTFYAQIPNAASGMCTVYCDTYNGGTLIGTSSTTFTATVNATTNKPDVTAAITDSNNETVALTGNNQKMVKYFSNAAYAITATAKNSATVSSRSINCGSLSGSSSSGTLAGVESESFVVTATDSRDLTNSITYNRTLVEYVKLTLNPTLYRTQPTNNQIAISYSGNYFNDTFGAQANTLTVKYRYREKGTTIWSSYTNLTPTASGNGYSGSQNLSQSFDYSKAYDFEVTAIDKIYTDGVTMTATVAEGIPIYAWNKTSFTHNTPVIFKDGKTLFDLVYPVGSIYMSVNSLNPETIFGGTWTAWGKGQVPVGVDPGDVDYNAAEKNGGAKTHILSENQIPSHSHSIYNPGTGGIAVVGSTSATVASGTTRWVPTGTIREAAIGWTGGNQGHSNLQPYITCYFWKRTG